MARHSNVVNTFIHTWHPPLHEAVSNQDSSIALIARLVVDVFFFFVISKRGIGTVSVPISVAVSLQAIQLFLQLPKPKGVFPGGALQPLFAALVGIPESFVSTCSNASQFKIRDTIFIIAYSFEGSAISVQIDERDPNDGSEKKYSDARRLVVCIKNTSTAHGFPASCYHHLNLVGQPVQPSLFPPKIKFNCIIELAQDEKPNIQPMFPVTTTSS